MSRVLKKTTNITGLTVCKDPHYELNKLYTRILNALRHYPVDYPYRTYTEKIVREKFDIIKSTPDVKTWEEKIGCGQIEEVIIQAQNELKAALELKNWEPWGPTIETPKNQWTWPPHK